MKTKFLWVFLCGAFFIQSLDVCAQGKKEKKVDDRAEWVKWLWKISYPVVHELAQGKLSENMPLEIPPSYSSDPRKLAYLEGVGRTIAGIWRQKGGG